MTAEVDFLPFAIGAGANVLDQTDYAILAALATGFQAGKASSAQINKALRQGTVMASVLAQFIANASGNNVLDNGDTTTLLNNLIAALNSNGAASFLQKANNFSEIKAAGAIAQAAALANLGSSDGTLKGRLLNVQTFTSSGSYTPTTGTRLIIVEQVAGGGSGASGAENGTGFYSGGGGGCSGSYLKFSILVSSLSTPVTVSIGAGGTAVTNNGGMAGGNTSFGSYAIALGGNGGLVLASSNSAPAIYGMSPTRSSYTLSSSATLIDFDYGQCGGDCIIQINGCRGGFGAASKLGGSVTGPGLNTSGIAANTYGGGGSGVSSNSASAYYSSGAGFAGYLKVWEYA